MRCAYEVKIKVLDFRVFEARRSKPVAFFLLIYPHCFLFVQKVFSDLFTTAPPRIKDGERVSKLNAYE